MKKLFIILCLLVVHSKSGTGQPGYPDSLRILPDNPVAGDTIRVALHTFLNTLERIAWLDFKVTLSEIDIQGCFPVSMFGVGSYYSDTILVGPLTAGNYLLRYTYHNSRFKDTCVVYASNDTTIPFEVLPPTGILRPTSGIATRIHPNPVSEILHIRSDKGVAIRQVSIRDMQGRQVKGFYNLENGSLDVSFLPQGVYLIYLVTDQGRVAHRFFKESTN